MKISFGIYKSDLLKYLAGDRVPLEYPQHAYLIEADLIEVEISKEGEESSKLMVRRLGTFNDVRYGRRAEDKAQPIIPEVGKIGS